MKKSTMEILLEPMSQADLSKVEPVDVDVVQAALRQGMVDRDAVRAVSRPVRIDPRLRFRTGGGSSRRS